MSNRDHYSNFAQLRASEPADSWRIQTTFRGSAVAIIAPHGGSIERGTSEIARAIAGEDLSLYLFEGLKAKGNRALHITSTNFDEPAGRELISNSDTVVAVHGERNNRVAVAYLGGRDEVLGAAIRRELRAKGFTVKKHKKPKLQGTYSANICNRGRSGRGVQLELSKGLRRQLFAALTPDGRQHPIPRLQAFAGAVRLALGV